MAKVKSTHTMVKLVSAAKTGYEKWFSINRNSPKLNLILYDPRAKRHCLFTEDRKRRIAERPKLVFDRSHR
ncbi:mitochondrial 54S ribosomal protein YmL39 [Scheffersomyces amazonensis]|uniref:mitochondrial 54S ribosomal protein YmL39 n=1 Tax=Scheffersomyces amazonensis TaxID=1078765 RepID=UPI00315D3EC4